MSKCSSLFSGPQPICSAINNKGELEIEAVFVIPYTRMDYVYFVTGPIGNSMYWPLITDKPGKKWEKQYEIETEFKVAPGLTIDQLISNTTQHPKYGNQNDQCNIKKNK